MSAEVQAVVRGRTREAAALRSAAPHSVALCAALGGVPWGAPSREDYDTLAR